MLDPRRFAIASRVLTALPASLVHLSALLLAGLMLVSAGQPLFTEDTWWYLAMGEAYLAHGPWLDADPLLHTATGPPAPAAWLSAVSLASIERAWGFAGLRVAHAAMVALVLALAWSALRRASGSRVYASLGSSLFILLAAYRLFQLRPHLFSIAAALVLVWMLLAESDGPSRWRLAAAALLCAVWANMHAAFVLGPVLVGAAISGLLLRRWLGRAAGNVEPARLTRLVAALGLVLLATLANPQGAEPHGLYFVAGEETPDLAIVADEWAPFGLFELPTPNFPPSLLSWGVAWILIVLCAASVLVALRRRPALRMTVDPALVGVAAASLIGWMLAVRFSWLAIFPLLALGQILRGSASERWPARPATRWALAVACLVLVAGFVRIGAWPMISKGIRPATYSRPYPATKYYAHAVWFLRDSGLQGNLVNDYAQGNFLGYWLAPELRGFVNGSLNLPREAMDASRAIVARRGSGGASFLELLDRYEVDVFFGTGLPAVPPGERPAPSTTAHLEGTPGWIQVFRNVRSAVFVRDVPRNQQNLERVSAYYAHAGVPFDAAAGFDPGRAIRETPTWAFEHGIIPEHLRQLEAQARSFDAVRGAAARDQLASIHLALGLYEQAEPLDRRLSSSQPAPISAARRTVWSLMQQGRTAESLAAARLLEALATPDDGFSALLVSSARRRAGLESADSTESAGKPFDAARTVAARTPFLTAWEAHRLLAGYREPEARLRQH